MVSNQFYVVQVQTFGSGSLVRVPAGPGPGSRSGSCRRSALGFRNERIQQEKVSVFGLIFSEVSHGKQISQKMSLSGDTLAEYARTGLSLFGAK